MILKRHKRLAFTLVEILVGMMVSALIIGAAYSSWLAASNAWRKGRVSSLNHQYARSALSLIDQNLRAALPPSSEEKIVFETGNYVITDTELAADSVRFTTTGNRTSAERPGYADFCEVEFYLDVSEETGEPSLMMKRWRIPMDNQEFEGEIAELAPNVVSFNLKYYDGLEFLDDWTSTQLPKAVQVNLVLYDFQDEENAASFQKLITLAARIRP